MSATPNTASTRKRILVAEDDPAIATLLVRVLSQHFEVVHAADGLSAVRVASQLPAPNLLLLDVMLPGADGYVVAQRVRALDHMKQVPIIFLTARTSPLDVIRGIQHGARHYIHKPFKIDDVLSKVKKSLGE